MAKDAVVDAIDDVSNAVEANVADEADVLSELTRVRRERVEGVPLGDALGTGAGPPRVLVTLDRIVDRLTLGSARLRRTLITSLVREGETVTAVARRFKVTHQRISSIIRRR